MYLAANVCLTPCAPNNQTLRYIKITKHLAVIVEYSAICQITEINIRIPDILIHLITTAQLQLITL